MDNWFTSIFGNLKDFKLPEDKTQYCIYFVKCNDVFKIGTTSNIRKRLKSMQTSNPVQMNLAYVISIPKTYKHKEVEKALHTIFEDNCLRGEWYKIMEEDIERIKLLSIDHILNIAEKMKKIKEENSPRNLPKPVKPENQTFFDFLDDENL